MQLRIASINIERSKHLKRVESFLKWYQPDVLCLQELCARDIPIIEAIMGNKLTYAPMTLCPSETELEPNGIGLVAWGQLEDITTTYYHGTGHPTPTMSSHKEADGQMVSDPASIDNAIISATYQGFRIATTHLIVTPDGQSTPCQLAIADKLIQVAKLEAERVGGLLLCGDFNAPRGNPTFQLLADTYTDGIPASYTTSLDPDLHKIGKLKDRMVDGLFHTPSYKLEDATLHTGVSDHCALTCTLSLNSK